MSMWLFAVALRAAYWKITHLTLSLWSLLISSDKLNDETEEAEFGGDLYCPACEKFLKTEKA